MSSGAVGPSTGAIVLRDLSVCYSETGAGQLIVLVHGLAQDHRSWAPQFAALQRHHVLAYDVRGHGGTDVGNPSGSLEQLGDDLIALLEWSGPAAVVGFSLGGTIALWAAAQRPDLVTEVVAVATSSVVGRSAASWYRERVQLVDEGRLEELAAAIVEDTRAQIVRDDVDVQAIARDRVEAVGSGAGYRNAAVAMSHLRETPLTPRLADVSQPVTVVYGTADVFCPRKAAEIMVAALPDAELQAIEGAGHLINVDAPDRLTNAIVGRSLAEFHSREER